MKTDELIFMLLTSLTFRFINIAGVCNMLPLFSPLSKSLWIHNKSFYRQTAFEASFITLHPRIPGAGTM